MNMDRDTELQRLEQFVEKLLLNFAELKEEKKKLLNQLKDRDSSIAQLEGTIVELQGDISSKENERSEISLRVGKLVEQIEDWELGLDEDQEYANENGNDIEGNTDDEGRVQHDLFSTSDSNE